MTSTENYVGFIYEWTNLINGKKYIGSHRGSLNDGYTAGGTAINKAFKKYGMKNFKREILEFVEDINFLKVKEEFYLKSVDAKKNRNYYNLSNTPTGGYEHIDWTNVRKGWHKWANEMLKKPVYQFDLFGKFIRKFDSLTEAAKHVSAKSPSNIKYTCEGKFKNAHGYIWSYYDILDKNNFRLPHYSKGKKKVSTPHGVFNSVTEVVKYYNLSSTKIVRDRCLSEKDKWKEWKYIFNE